MKTKYDSFERLFVFACLLVAIRLVSISSVSGQVMDVLTGMVTTPDGKPIPEVLVYGSESRKCCEFKREQTRTDASGRFTLKDPGAVVHFEVANFQFKMWIVQPNVCELHFILEPETEAATFFVPACKDPASGTRRIPGGKYGVQFDVPKKDLIVSGGKMDVDYRRFLIKPKTGSSYLELWFGPYAFSDDPGDDLLLDSVSFTEKRVSVVSGKGWGNDFTGELGNGEHWRHTYVGPGDGARYKASLADVPLFDKVVNSACMPAYPGT
jgi:hypothetical protein